MMSDTQLYTCWHCVRCGVNAYADILHDLSVHVHVQRCACSTTWMYSQSAFSLYRAAGAVRVTFGHRAL